MNTIISHIYKDTTDCRWVIQSNEEHSEGGRYWSGLL